MARIISIVNQKGGTGKSACTANLAVGLAQKNMKVLIVDADPQSDVSAGFGYRDCDDSNETLTALMDAVMKDEDIPSDCYIRHQAAVELSYLRTEEQQILFQYMSNHNMVPSMKQAKELKQISKERMLTYSEIDQICMNESNEKVQVQIPAKKLKQYFPETYTKTQMEEIIFKLLASWAEREGKE